MKTNNSSYILILFLFIILASCSKSDKETYTVSGRFVDGTNPKNKFSNIKLHFEDYYNHKDIVELGETFTDSNGYFKFSYEYGTPFRTNFLRILVDSNFIAANKLKSLELCSNWDKTFYLGDSAIFDLYIDKPLSIYDTLYFVDWDSVYKVIGPQPVGLIRRFKTMNFNQYEILGYGVGTYNYNNNPSVINYIPTGEPITDELHLKLTN